eukprot:GFYU01039173.1.p1 GENE.GFYU01039173.1~~GFYU01039173.1.p1  ORF type:complete len:132 (+),score=18.09 GFYU01039173.1:167-562(+)
MFGLLQYPELYLLPWPTLWFVHFYNEKADSQMLNRQIIGNVCGWNLLHVLAFWVLSLYLGPQSYGEFAEIGLFMVAWYCIESYTFRSTAPAQRSGQDKYNTVYENQYQPRLDDFVFNSVGVILYIVTKQWF